MKKLILILAMVLVAGVGWSFEGGDIVRETYADTTYEVIRIFSYHNIYKVKIIKSGEMTYTGGGSLVYACPEMVEKLKKEIVELKQIKKEEAEEGSPYWNLQDKYDKLSLDYAEQVAEIKQLKERIKLLEESLAMLRKIDSNPNYRRWDVVYIKGQSCGKCYIEKIAGKDDGGWNYNVKSFNGATGYFVPEKDLIRAEQ